LRRLPQRRRGRPLRRSGDPGAELLERAKQVDPAFAGFSAERGRALYVAPHGTRDPNVTACASCHGSDPRRLGQNVKTGKSIEPMAVSANPKRYTSADETDKWFRRNCKDVIGRECTPAEKGDFITFMITP
jgi:mono/diheme cytochrome c family protein